MDSSIIVAIIGIGGTIVTGVFSVIAVAMTNAKSNKDIENKLATQQAVTDTKIDELTREVREHNNFARRMPVLEEKVSVANHRIDDLEKKIM